MRRVAARSPRRRLGKTARVQQQQQRRLAVLARVLGLGRVVVVPTLTRRPLQVAALVSCVCGCGCVSVAVWLYGCVAEAVAVAPCLYLCVSVSLCRWL